MQQDENDTNICYQVLYKTSVFCISACLISSTIMGQVIDSSARANEEITRKQPCETEDLIDYIRQLFHLKPSKKQRTTSIFIAPVFGSTPSTGSVYCATLQGAFQLPDSRLSAFQTNVQYTAKQQFTLSLKNNVYARKNMLFLSGDWSFYNYSQPTYGLGTNAPNGKLSKIFGYNNVGEPDDSLVQPMIFKYILELLRFFEGRIKMNYLSQCILIKQ